MTEHDYVIVGSGSAGGFLALRLSEDPLIRVLLLEAGPSDAHWTTRIPAAARYTFDGGPRNWCFETEPEPHMNGRRIFQPRGKTLGGSSSLNGMVFVRGHPRDFDRWVEAGAHGWSYEEVLPHYRSMERYEGGGDAWRGDGGPVAVRKSPRTHPIEEAFLEAGRQAGHPQPADYNGAEQEGVARFDSNIDGGWRSGTARACIRPASRRPNLAVLTGAHATRIRIEGGRAVGVSYRHGGEDREARAEGEVILSAGAFQSPQLLMLSGVGPADHLREHGIEVLADLPGVGENLQDHLEVHLMHRCPHRGMSMNKWLARHRILLAGAQWLLLKSGPAAHAPSKVGAFLRSGDGAGYPDIQFHFWPYLLEGWTLPPDKDGYGLSLGPVRSPSRGWVRLRSADPFAAPRIQLNGLSHPEDFRIFRAAIEHAREIADQPAFEFCRGEEIRPGRDARAPDDLDAYVRAHANSAYHPCGTARMGFDSMAATDPRGRVHGIERLRVADASIMPAITNGNINAPCMMIGERIAAMAITDRS